MSVHPINESVARNETDRLLPKEAAQILRCTAERVRALCQVGEIEHEVEFDRGGRARYYVTPAALEAYRRRRTVRIGHR